MSWCVHTTSTVAAVQTQTSESNTLLFTAMCLVLAGRPLHACIHSMLTALPTKGQIYTDIYYRETGILNHFESLRPCQVCPLGPLEVPVLQLKTGLRATSIFNNMPSAAELCQTSTRNTPHLFSSYSSHTFQPLP